MRKTRSLILEAVHETAQGLSRAGAIDQATLSEFNRMCLSPINLAMLLLGGDEKA